MKSAKPKKKNEDNFVSRTLQLTGDDPMPTQAEYQASITAKEAELAALVVLLATIKPQIIAQSATLESKLSGNQTTDSLLQRGNYDIQTSMLGRGASEKFQIDQLVQDIAVLNQALSFIS